MTKHLYNIKKIECLLEHIIFNHSFGIDGCREELTEINGARAIHIYLLNNVIDVANIAIQSKAFSEYFNAFDKLIFRNGPISIIV